MLAKKTSKNQITLPKAIVNAFPDAQYFDVRIKDEQDPFDAGQDIAYWIGY